MKFLILCFPRTGSTSLITAIGQHAGIRQGMELFNPVLEGNADYVAWRKQAFREMMKSEIAPLDSTGYLDLKLLDATELVRRFYRKFDGTKIMYDQLPRSSAAWDGLAGMEDLSVIKLCRNPIAAAVSFRFALDSGIWHVPCDEEEKRPNAVVFDPSYFAWFYDHFCAGAADICRHFISRNVLKIEYEDLSRDWDGTMALVDRYLGLRPIRHAKPFRKGLGPAPHALVANREEVRQTCLQHAGLAPHVAAVFGE